ncbi:hypothetical protein HWV01_16470 [Moritella sp. 5]|uniref:hypothetical protein n=1 Tax=Moritella sp. 5 TaxID=2746231 RepID=UPI001BA65FAE|nr:hypothetical protein [Moritella sp. 5]QUM81767.1 hypothetical protein HWV01_16470 [Moritella sp. 5]
MNISKHTIVASLLSSLLMGCGGSGGGGGSSTKDSDRVLQYNFDNIVSEFLGAGIDYKLTTGQVNSASDQDTVKAYNKQGVQVESFSITPTMLASNTCAQQPEPLNLEKGSSRFNISPIGSDGSRRVVNFKNLPKKYQPNFTDKCEYQNYSLHGRYIIGSSNEKLTDLGENEEVVNPTDLVSLADMSRLLSLSIPNLEKPLSKYMSREVNMSDHEFIVNKDSGAVRVFDTDLNQYVNLDGTKNIQWQFYGENYLISSFLRTKVVVYDIENRKLIDGASFNVIANFGAKLEDLADQEIVTSYGIFPDSINVKGLPFKFVYDKPENENKVYVLKQGVWVIATDGEPDQLPVLTTFFDNLKGNVSQFDYDLTNDNFYATYKLSGGGFTVKTSTLDKLMSTPNIDDIDDIDDIKIITGFPDEKIGIQKINGSVVVKSHKRDQNKRTDTFYMIKDNDKSPLGGISTENMKSIEASSHN